MASVNEKLQFLMLLTNTTNTRLAQAVHFDVSYISRIKTGKRSVPQNKEFLENVSEFFAEEIKDERAKETASAVIGSGKGWPGDKDRRKQRILSWLQNDTVSFEQYIHEYLSEKGTGAGSEKTAFGNAGLPADWGQSVQTFFGNSGKREGILKALDYLIGRDERFEFFLYSDEKLEWFMEDRAFLTEWRRRILTLIDRGCTMNLISTLDREYSEIKEGIRMWLPVLFSGRLQCFYRPRIRDSVYNRTLFVVKDCLAFTCNSLKITDYHAVNTLFFEKEAIRAFMEEYNGYASLCLPLFNQYLPDDGEALCRRVSLLCETAGNTSCGGPSPSLFTMPESVLTAFGKRGDGPAVEKMVREAKTYFETLMREGYKMTEILVLPDPQELLDGKISVRFRNACGVPSLYYLPEEYAEHVRNALRISKNYPAYHLLIAPEKLPKNLSFLVREGTGLFLESCDPPNRCLFTAERSLVDSIMEMCETFDFVGVERKLTGLKLKQYFHGLGI